MITYFIKSGLCLALVFVIYKLLLEREHTYVFNRYYLLFGLCFSFVVPFVTMTVSAPETVTEVAPTILMESELVASEIPMEVPQETTTSLLFYLIYAYGIICLFFGIRFLKNLFKITYRIQQNVKTFYKKASLVLLDEKVLPHTFWDYIFIDKQAHDAEEIAEELYTHELAHAEQKHTLDILLIEVAQIVCWFNPVLYYYKKAIQLNHEFLADEAVLKSSNQITEYQHLLLQVSAWNNTTCLTSNLNFSVTKKRLQMMTKHTSKVRAWLVAIITVPVFVLAIFLFSTKVTAQEKKQDQSKQIESVQNTTPKVEKTLSKTEYYKNTTIYVSDKYEKPIAKKYNELTAKQQEALMPVPKTPVAKRPSQSLLNDWKDSNTYAIWIDGKHVPNSSIAAKNIVHYTGSFVYKNARSAKFPQAYQMHLYTEKGFEAYKNEIINELPEGSKLYIKTAPSHKKEKKYETWKPGTIIKVKDIKRLHDIIVRIDEKNNISVNRESIKSIDDLSGKIDDVVASLKSKKDIKAVIMYYNDKRAKYLIIKAKLILERHNIKDVKMVLSYPDLDVVPPPPPKPPKPQKAPKPVKIEVAPKKSKNQKIAKWKDVKYFTLNGEQYYYVMRNGDKIIYNKYGEMVDERGTVIQSTPVTKKQLAQIVEFPKGKATKDQKVGHVIIKGEKHYFVSQNGNKTIYNRYGEVVNEKGEKLPPPPPKKKSKNKV